MDPLDWHSLRSFIAVAEEGHITRAAERLNTQQPPMSLRIRALEERLGVQLFRRKPRGVELTAAGEAFLAHAYKLLDQHERALDAVRRADRGELGRLAIGTVPTGPLHPVMPSSVRLFCERYPDARISIHECLRYELLDRLRVESVDIAFMRSVPEVELGLSVEVLLTEPMVIALPRGHPLGKRRIINVGDLQGESFVVFAREQGPYFYDLTVAACQRAGFTPRIAQEAPRVTLALALVAAGLGVSLVPSSMQRIALDGVLFKRLEDRSKLEAILAIGWRKSDPSRVLANYIEVVRKLSASA